jgi:kynurenine formamidase
MTKSTSSLPSFRQLPVRQGAPKGSSWGVFGDDDQSGTINLLTSHEVLSAIQLVKKGKVFSLNWDLEEPDPPLAGRGALRHTIHKDSGGTDDYYDNFYTQRSSQWDALSHVADREHGFYNGCQLDEITGRPGSRNGIDNWARRGIVGRFVLADIARWRESVGRPLDQRAADPIGVEDIVASLASANVSVRQGDILLLRFGWMDWYNSADSEGRAYAAGSPGEIGTPGLGQDESLAEWLWDSHVSVVATDSPALEMLPVDQSTMETFLHVRLIALLGLAVGEMFQLEDLAEDCLDDSTYEGLFVAAPLNKVGGSGSPANALAIK